MVKPHQSVLLDEVLKWLSPQPGQTVVDGTLGAGGHAEAILERSSPDGKLVGFDKDPQALKIAKEVLGKFGDRVMLIRDDFKNITQHLERLNVRNVQAILLDLGISSMQLDRVERGFSFRMDGPLDMRMNPEASLTAEEVVNAYPKEKLLRVLWSFGEERFARKIVERLLAKRTKKRIKTTGQLADLVNESVPAFYRHGRLHPATRIFQALRIEVNREIESLEVFLPAAPDALAKNGRLAVISFHSIEDRVVKNTFREWARQEKGRVLTKKPLVPSEAEVRMNPRSRSAKIRVFERL